MKDFGGKSLRGWGAVGFVLFVLVAAWLSGTGTTLADGWNPSSKADRGPFPGSILNTRHNLTMSYDPSGVQQTMLPYRNDYVEVCVYCHTPHAANSTVDAPLWNRTTLNRTYALYSQPSETGMPVTTPGPNSLTCLSCHDGFTAIDSIINMPTQKTGAYAGFDQAQEVTVNKQGFLNEWSGGTVGGHVGFVAGTTNADLPGGTAQGSSCYTCHQPNGAPGAPDFGIFVIGQQYADGSLSGTGGYLADDHPIGVKYPDAGPNVDYNEPTVKAGRIAFFDLNGNNHADPEEIRLYDTGDGYEVECGSCHDPHGVRVSRDSNRMVPSFLRVGSLAGDITNGTLLPDAGVAPGLEKISGNAGSELCLTCHVK